MLTYNAVLYIKLNDGKNTQEQHVLPEDSILTGS